MPNVNLKSVQEKTETDSVTALELQRNRRVLHFCDGTMEEESDSEQEVDVTDKSLEVTIDEKELQFVPLLRYKAHKVGSNILSGIDYVGGGLASFLGISSPKYASEIGHYQRTLEQSKRESDGNETWRGANGDANKNTLKHVITTVPTSDIRTIENQ